MTIMVQNQHVITQFKVHQPTQKTRTDTHDHILGDISTIYYK